MGATTSQSRSATIVWYKKLCKNHLDLYTDEYATCVTCGAVRLSPYNIGLTSSDESAKLEA